METNYNHNLISFQYHGSSHHVVASHPLLENASFNSISLISPLQKSCSISSPSSLQLTWSFNDNHDWSINHMGYSEPEFPGLRLTLTPLTSKVICV